MRGIEPINPEFRPAFRLDGQIDTFSLTWGINRRLDGELGIYVSRWTVTGGKATRVHPLALDPEGFLDHWIQLPWEEARVWARGEMVAWHTRLRQIPLGAAEITFVQPCPAADDSSERWEIGMEVDQRAGPNKELENLYVRVSRKTGIFYAEAVSSARGSDCPGMTRPKIRDFTLPVF